MTPDLDLGEIERDVSEWVGLFHERRAKLLALVTALRRERGRAEKVEAEIQELRSDFHANTIQPILDDARVNWKARALAAEAGLREILHVASAVMMWTVGGDVDAPRALRAVCELAGKYEELRDRERSAQERGGEK